MTTWLITGCSSGLGKSFARAVLEASFNAVVTARNVQALDEFVSQYPDRAVAAELDVTDKAQIESVVKLAEQRFGAIDVLLNNAGYGYRGTARSSGLRLLLGNKIRCRRHVGCTSQGVGTVGHTCHRRRAGCLQNRFCRPLATAGKGKYRGLRANRRSTAQGKRYDRRHPTGRSSKGCACPDRYRRE